MLKNHMLNILGFIVASILCGLLAVYTSGFMGYFLLGYFVLILISAIFNLMERFPKRFPFYFVRRFGLVVPLYFGGLLVFGFLCTMASFANLRFFSENARFPLSEIEWIQVDDEGVIYSMSYAYSRLQLYDCKGKFLRGWFLPLSRGPYHVSLSEKGEILYTRKNGTLYVYDKSGNLLKEEHDQQLSTSKSTKVVAKNGNIYELRYSLFQPKIVKINQNGEQATLVKDSLGLWMHGMPLPGTIFLVLSGVILCFGIGINTSDDKKFIRKMLNLYRERCCDREECDVMKIKRSKGD